MTRRGKRDGFSQGMQWGNAASVYRGCQMIYQWTERNSEIFFFIFKLIENRKAGEPLPCSGIINSLWISFFAETSLNLSWRTNFTKNWSLRPVSSRRKWMEGQFPGEHVNLSDEGSSTFRWHGLHQGQIAGRVRCWWIGWKWFHPKTGTTTISLQPIPAWHT